MDISFKKVADLWKKKPRDASKLLVAPDRDWRILFGFFWVSFFLAVIWSGYLYFSYTVMTYAGSGGSDLQPPLSKESFKPVFDIFDARKDAFDEVRFGGKILGDPSR